MARPLRNLRWYVGGLLFLSTVINYIDRQTLSVLAPYLKADYHWTNTDFALVLIAFRVAYSVGQTLAGRVVDRDQCDRARTDRSTHDSPPHPALNVGSVRASPNRSN